MKRKSIFVILYIFGAGEGLCHRNRPPLNLVLSEKSATQKKMCGISSPQEILSASVLASQDFIQGLGS